jgi:hypothetical protein
MPCRPQVIRFHNGAGKDYPLHAELSYEGLRQSGARGQTATVETQQFRDFVLSTRPKSIAAAVLQDFPTLVAPAYGFRDLGNPARGVNATGPADGIPDVGTAAYVPNIFRNGDQGNVRIDHELKPGKDREEERPILPDRPSQPKPARQRSHA